MSTDPHDEAQPKKDHDRDDSPEETAPDSGVVGEEEFTYDSDDTTQDTVKKLKEKLKKCEQEKQEYLDGWQRAKADFVNSRRKNEEQRADLIRNAGREVLTQVLPVVDSFDMAFADEERWQSVDKEWRTGVERIYDQLKRVLKDNGVQEIDPVGESFDPSAHEAVEMVECEDKKDDGAVVEVLQKGYEYNGSILRTAKVKVGKTQK